MAPRSTHLNPGRRAASCTPLGLFTKRTRAGTALFQANLLITRPLELAKPRLLSLLNPASESPMAHCSHHLLCRRGETSLQLVRVFLSAKDLGSSVRA